MTPTVRNNVFLALKPAAGMCNRLRAIFSFYYLSRDKNLDYLVIWESCEKYCPGNIFDYYIKIPGTEYIIWRSVPWGISANSPSRMSNQVQMYKGVQLIERGSKFAKEKGFFTFYGSGGEYGNSNAKKYSGRYTNIYTHLVLNNKTQAIINNNKRELGKYIAVHIRRTDHKKGKQESTQNYINFIQKYPNNYNIYLATDCIKVKRDLFKHFEDRIKIITFNHRHHTRQTSMLDAIIDLHMCIESDFFYGTNGSSFSELIYQKRYYDNKLSIDEFKTAKEKGAIGLDKFPYS
tara:strand:- start:537 stop:1409 length:873 start_codon:yes stop_codon:yes gene_type:complete